MKPIILPSTLGELKGKLGSLALVRQTINEKENSVFKTVKLRLEIDLMSHPTHSEGLVSTLMCFKQKGVISSLSLANSKINGINYSSTESDVK